MAKITFCSEDLVAYSIRIFNGELFFSEKTEKYICFREFQMLFL